MFRDRSRSAYCTYFDSGYETRARIMVKSLRRAGETGPVFALCFDALAMQKVNDWGDPEVFAIDLETLEAAYPELLQVKPTRSRHEYYFTCSPLLPRWIIRTHPDLEWVTYLDADLWFLGDVQPVFDDMGAKSIGIIPHGFSERHARSAQYGTFNVGWVSFRNDVEGQRILEWWGERCLEWCFDKVEDGRFADQGYLDQFSSLSTEVAVLNAPGFNVAPWNLDARDISLDVRRRPLANGSPLVFMHFHRVRRSGLGYFIGLRDYGVRATPVLLDSVYRPYLQELEKHQSQFGNGRHWDRGGISLTGRLRRVIRRLRQDLLEYLNGDFISLNSLSR